MSSQSTLEGQASAAGTGSQGTPSPAVVEGTIRYEGWRVAAAAGVGVFFATLVVAAFPILLKPLSQEFSWSREEVSRAFGIGAAVAALCAGPLGYLLDRVGPRRIAIPSLIVLGCLFASLSLLSPRLWHLYAVYAALGATAIGSSPVAYGRAIATWFSTRRGLALALVITGGALGGMVHPPAAAALSQAFGWRGACLALGALVLVLGVPAVARFLRARPAGLAGATATAGSALREALRTRMFWLLAAGLFCGTMVQNSVIVHLSALLTDRGVDPGRAAVGLSAMAAAGVVGRLATGWLIDRMFAAHVAVAMMGLAAAGAFLLSDAQSFGMGVLGAMLVGFGTGGESDVVPYLLSRYFGLRSFSVIYGLAWTANATGGALGPILMGRSFDTAGSYGPILVRLAVLALVAAVLMLALPRYAARELSPTATAT